MSHTSDDRILESLLELLDEQDEQSVQQHLRDCDRCRERHARLRVQTDVIGGIAMEWPQPRIPLPRPRRPWRRWMQTAAMFLLGCIAGYSVATGTRTESVRVIPQAETFPVALADRGTFASCESVGLAVDVGEIYGIDEQRGR